MACLTSMYRFQIWTLGMSQAERLILSGFAATPCAQ